MASLARVQFCRQNLVAIAPRTGHRPAQPLPLAEIILVSYCRSSRRLFGARFLPLDRTRPSIGPLASSILPVISALILAMAAGPRPASAQAFDCAKARGPVETAICASPELKAQDSALAESYRRVLSALGSGNAALA